MIRIITALEASVINNALREAYNMLLESDVDERELTNILEAIIILNNLEQKSIEEVID